MRERTFLLVKPDGLPVIGEARRRLYFDDDVTVGLGVRVRLTAADVRAFYPERAGGPFDREIVSYLTTGDCVVLDVEGEGACEEVKKIKGKTYASGLRLDFADNFIHNTFHCPDDPEACERELKILLKRRK